MLSVRKVTVLRFTMTALQVQYFEEVNPADPYSKIKITITTHYG